MNYINLAVALFVGAAALVLLGTLIRVAFTTAKYVSFWGQLWDEAAFAVCATLSIWNFNVALSA